MWTSTDPSEQYWNLYSYPANPIIVIDPDGNFAWAPIIASTIIGGITGGINASYNDQNIFGGVLIGAGIGFASSVAGQAVGSGLGSILGNTQWNSIVTAGLSSGMAGGVGGFLGGFLNTWAFGGGPGSGFFEGDISRAGLVGLKSAGVGFALGFAAGAIDAANAKFLEKSVIPEKIGIPLPDGATSTPTGDLSDLSKIPKVPVHDILKNTGLGKLTNITWGDMLSQNLALACNFTPIVNAALPVIQDKYTFNFGLGKKQINSSIDVQAEGQIGSQYPYYYYGGKIEITGVKSTLRRHFGYY